MLAHGRHELAAEREGVVMVELAEQDTAVETIEATVNYIVDDGTKIFTQTAEPGASDVRTGVASSFVTAGFPRIVCRSIATASGSSATTPRSLISSMKRKCAGSITRRW